jgi:hypothetical protein
MLTQGVSHIIAHARCCTYMVLASRVKDAICHPAMPCNGVPYLRQIHEDRHVKCFR